MFLSPVVMVVFEKTSKDHKVLYCSSFHVKIFQSGKLSEHLDQRPIEPDSNCAEDQLTQRPILPETY